MMAKAKTYYCRKPGCNQQTGTPAKLREVSRKRIAGSLVLGIPMTAGWKINYECTNCGKKYGGMV